MRDFSAAILLIVVSLFILANIVQIVTVAILCLTFAFLWLRFSWFREPIETLFTWIADNVIRPLTGE